MSRPQADCIMMLRVCLLEWLAQTVCICCKCNLYVNTGLVQLSLCQVLPVPVQVEDQHYCFSLISRCFKELQAGRGGQVPLLRTARDLLKLLPMEVKAKVCVVLSPDNTFVALAGNRLVCVFGSVTHLAQDDCCATMWRLHASECLPQHTTHRVVVHLNHTAKTHHSRDPGAKCFLGLCDQQQTCM